MSAIDHIDWLELAAELAREHAKNGAQPETPTPQPICDALDMPAAVEMIL